MADVLVLCAHPQLESSHVNRALMDAAARLPRERVMVRDLYDAYPDYLIDVAAEQSLLAQARLVVWQHPIQWYSMPPLMKLWVDEVLSFGWAYGPGGTALRGKDLWLVASAGGPQASYHPASYNRYFFDAFLPPYEQTAALCGMRFVPPLVMFGAHRATEAEISAQAALYAGRLASYPDWPEIVGMEPAVECPVPAEARPAAQAA
jgi:glutathione-regulated potassium-efflux system ancillary protein KefF